MCKLHICMYICVYATYMCIYAFVTSTRVFVDAAHIYCICAYMRLFPQVLLLLQIHPYGNLIPFGHLLLLLPYPFML